MEVKGKGPGGRFSRPHRGPQGQSLPVHPQVLCTGVRAVAFAYHPLSLGTLTSQAWPWSGQELAHPAGGSKPCPHTEEAGLGPFLSHLRVSHLPRTGSLPGGTLCPAGGTGFLHPVPWWLGGTGGIGAGLE